MKIILLTEQEKRDAYEALVILMKQLDQSGIAREKSYADRLELIANKIIRGNDQPAPKNEAAVHLADIFNEYAVHVNDFGFALDLRQFKLAAEVYAYPYQERADVAEARVEELEDVIRDFNSRANTVLSSSF